MPRGKDEETVGETPTRARAAKSRARRKSNDRAPVAAVVSSADDARASTDSPRTRSHRQALPRLSQARLLNATADFLREFSGRPLPVEFVRVRSDSSRLGSELERLLKEHLIGRFRFNPGSRGQGVDFPDLNIDLKVTSIVKPQCSAPLAGTHEKIYGLPYNLLLVVYEWKSGPKGRQTLEFMAPILIPRRKTGDHRLTATIRDILDNPQLPRSAKKQLITRLIKDESVLYVERELAPKIAERVLREKPEQGKLTLSSAAQWRANFGRAIREQLEPLD